MHFVCIANGFPPRKWENYRNHYGTPARDDNIIAADNSCEHPLFDLLFTIATLLRYRLYSVRSR